MTARRAVLVTLATVGAVGAVVGAVLYLRRPERVSSATREGPNVLFRSNKNQVVVVPFDADLDGPGDLARWVGQPWSAVQARQLFADGAR